MTSLLNDTEIDRLGALVNVARDPLAALVRFLARTPQRGRVEIPLPEGRVAMLLTDEEARRVRAVL